MVRRAYLRAAEAALGLLADPAVAASWDRSSASPEFTVSGLAGHLARQVTHVPEILAQAEPAERPVTLLENYLRSRWIGVGPDDEANVGVRRSGEATATAGPAALTAQVETVLASLRTVLPAESAARAVHLPWGPWSLSLDDFLVTRMLEIAVHCDDLAVSVGVATPPMPGSVLDPVVCLLARLAVHRHGSTAVLRALSRAERAPATIAAI